MCTYVRIYLLLGLFSYTGAALYAQSPGQNNHTEIKINTDKIKNVLHQSTDSHANIAIGNIKNSKVNRARISVTTKNIDQSVSGRNNKATLSVGVVKNSTIRGAVDIGVNAANLTNQISGGQNNCMETSIGTIGDNDDDCRIQANSQLSNQSQSIKNPNRLANSTAPTISNKALDEAIQKAHPAYDKILRRRNIFIGNSARDKKVASYKFDTKESAMRMALALALVRSDKGKKEWAAYIYSYKDSNGKTQYKVTRPFTSDQKYSVYLEKSFIKEQGLVPDGAKIVGLAHNHPDDNEFSEKDLNVPKGKDHKDIMMGVIDAKTGDASYYYPKTGTTYKFNAKEELTNVSGGPYYHGKCVKEPGKRACDQW